MRAIRFMQYSNSPVQLNETSVLLLVRQAAGPTESGWITQLTLRTSFPADFLSEQTPTDPTGARWPLLRPTSRCGWLVTKVTPTAVYFRGVDAKGSWFMKRSVFEARYCWEAA